jgi:hypothetical protein
MAHCCDAICTDIALPRGGAKRRTAITLGLQARESLIQGRISAVARFLKYKIAT